MRDQPLADDAQLCSALHRDHWLPVGTVLTDAGPVDVLFCLACQLWNFTSDPENPAAIELARQMRADGITLADTDESE